MRAKDAKLPTSDGGGKPVLVLGLGNRLMMDDGVGVVVVERLKEEGPPGGRLQYEIGETDFAYCLALAEEAERLILVDAMANQKPPGRVTILTLQEIIPSGLGLSLHQAHIIDLLLQQDPQTSAVLIGIEPCQIRFHLGLSEEMEGQLDQIIDEVRAAITSMTPPS